MTKNSRASSNEGAADQAAIEAAEAEGLEALQEAEETVSGEPEAAQEPAFDLVVTEPFGDYQKGDRITDGEAQRAVYDAGSERNCVRVAR